jgi:cyclophilin family peptidyl-prolyl cis-trans isomerase
VGTDKRARQKELHRSRLEDARQEAARSARRRRITIIATVVVVVVGGLALVAVFNGNDNTSTVATKSSTTTGAPTTSLGETTTSAAGAKPVALVGPGPGASITGETPCPKADGSSPRTTTFAKAPPMCIDPKKTYTATFDTSKGPITVDLNTQAAPKTVNNFVVLSRYHFYDGQPIFRLIKDFAAQFGDPSKSPSNKAQFGYTIPDELPQKGDYKVGSLVMANTGSPDTGGAQAFFVLGDQGTQLPPQYALVGQPTAGLDTISAINAVPSVQTSDNDGAPTQQVTIKSVTITEK